MHRRQHQVFGRIDQFLLALGMGKLLLDSIITLDRPVVVAYLILIVFFLVMLNLVTDILYSVLDPRVRLQTAKA